MGDTTYEAVVVGCGAAGLSAALTHAEAAQAQGREARIAVLEVAPESERGGATRWTTAGFRMGPDHQLDPFWVGRMQEVSKGLADMEYVETFAREVPDSADFLVEHGVELFYGDERKVAARTFEHLTFPNGGGLAIVEALSERLSHFGGVEFHYETEAVRLSLSDEGAVDGVQVRRPDGLLKTLRAQSVVLACGGFEGNKEMLSQYVGRDSCDLVHVAPGIRFNKGAGIKMAMEIGADTAGQFDSIHAELVDLRTDRADAVIYGHNYTVVVDSESKRFIDEGAGAFDETFEIVAYETWRHHGSRCFFICDGKFWDEHEPLHSLFDTDMPPVAADSIGELATLLGLEPDELEATLAEYNAACDQDTPYDPSRLDGKGTTGLTPPKSNWALTVDTAPFYGWPMAASICFTYGGLRTDSQSRVLSRGGTVIPNLYAAGEIVGLFYHQYPSAVSVLRSVTFGRISGAQTAVAATAAASVAA